MPTHASLFQTRFADDLQPAEHILVAGAGGGFDIYAGLPLYFALRATGKRVSLANMSFTSLRDTTSHQVHPHLWRVDATSTARNSTYFPEALLARWLSTQDIATEIFAFEKTGVRQTREAYRWLCQFQDIDTIILVDGGTDILMTGDEAGLGTPAEDVTSLIAAKDAPHTASYIACLGFGIDAFHGVCHAHFLQNVAALERDGKFLGAQLLQNTDINVAKFSSAVRFAHAHMPGEESIVNASIVSAIDGHFGDYHLTQRTQSSELFINPLMAIYWYFDLPAVANRNLYAPRLQDTTSVFETNLLIEAFREEVSIRPRRHIPV